MQRWTALLFVGLVALALVAVVLARPGQGDVRAEPSASASVSAGGPLIMAPTALPAPTIAMDMDAGPAPAPIFNDDPRENADAGITLPDGTPVPMLGAEAPKQVGFGVILVFYRGAQGAPQSARTREEALTLATTIATEAKSDFAAAAKKADVGIENAGTMVRGVLEPVAEYTLFNLGVGDVGGPVDSPRGFYVFKRIE